MKIYPTFPLAFSHTGQRTNNQDSLHPAVSKATEQTQLFVVCDGIGGADKGEVASQLLCDTVADYALAMSNPMLDAVHIQVILNRAYEAYRTYLAQHPLLSRMGSTLALLQLHQQGVTVVHIGDSRVYQLRGGKVIFQTKDHRQVTDMVEAGIITATQALTHPWRNRLSRAVMASVTDKEDEPVKLMADVVMLTDVQAGDYFFLCTDGVPEAVDIYMLETILASNMPDQAKSESLQALCSTHSKDNYSGYLIGISYVAHTEPKPVIQTITNYAD
ncbi:PP2C family protein-serine/threonine phosphatase [Spirosoma fluviale]|uniref:Serine/threonine protein phosphatase PrpC n=1 Tax=Spirosoma fluviale TaxID=1597977 RepID=A0A286F8C1_9BACT|nr:PP2C family serine/threonine-protein phosphatase [Spirosoma fluviale]SOD79477.1 Serine/threonine protein phosphatase PrpC [Spirosoma fluviale]